MSLVIQGPTGAGLVLRKDFTWNETVWNPSMIQTALWLDAADASTITAVSGGVSQWNDKSGGGINFTQSNSALRPTTNSQTLNGLNVVSFDGVDDNMNAGDALDNVWTAVGGGFNLFYVARNRNITSNNGSILAKLSNSPLNLRQFASTLRTSVSQLVTVYTPDVFNYTVVNGSTTIASNQWVTISQAYSDTGSGSANTTSRVSITVDGSVESLSVLVAAGQLSTIQNTTGSLSIGAIIGNGTQNSNNLPGEIAEIIVLPVVASTTDRQKMEGYLAHKWGLTANLPADHPYKTVGPTP